VEFYYTYTHTHTHICIHIDVNTKEAYYDNSGLLAVTIIGVWSAKFKKMLPVITQGDSYSFDIAESECDNQTAQSPTSVKEGRIKWGG